MAKSKKSCNYTKCLFGYASKGINIIEKFSPSLLLLAMRLWIANIFFKSGLTKISNMDTAIMLFEDIYQVPIIPPILGAYIAVSFELLCPILLAVGFLTRFTTLPLIGMTLIIKIFVFPDAQSNEEIYWLFLLITLLTYGAGKLSADKFMKIR